MNYQQAFDAYYDTHDKPEDAPYNWLVEPLAYVLNQADPTGQWTPKELAGAFHNFVVSSVGETDLTKIAKSICGWVKAPDWNLRGYTSYNLRQVIDGKLPWQMEKRWQGPKIYTGTVAAWTYDVDRYLKQNKIRRNSKAYQTFVQEKAAKAAEKMIAEAETTITAFILNDDEGLKEARKWADEAQDQVNFLLRLARLVETLQAVSGFTDSRDLVEALRQSVDELAEKLVCYKDRLTPLSADQFDPLSVVKASVTDPTLKAMIEHYEKELAS